VTGSVPPPADDRGHRVKWFGPDRPVDGGTVFERPPADDRAAGWQVCVVATGAPVATFSHRDKAQADADRLNAIARKVWFDVRPVSVGPAEAAEPAADETCTPAEEAHDEMCPGCDACLWPDRTPGEAAEPATGSGIDLSPDPHGSLSIVRAMRSAPYVECKCGASAHVVPGSERAWWDEHKADEAGAPDPAAPEPGYQRIADAINAACEAADIDLTVVHDGRVLDYVPGVRWLATVLDKAGLIDWAAFQDGAVSVSTTPAAPADEMLTTAAVEPLKNTLRDCLDNFPFDGGPDLWHVVDQITYAVLNANWRPAGVSTTPAAAAVDAYKAREEHALHVRDVALQRSAALTVAARVVLTEWDRMHPSGYLAMYPAMDALRAALAGSAAPPEESSK